MSTTANQGVGEVSATGQKAGVFRRAVSRALEARHHQAQRYVNGYLLTLDDATLATYGYDRRRLEREGSSSYPL